MSELLCECCPMTVDQALEYVESGRPGRRQSHAAYTLAKEVRRLRAAVETIKELPRYEPSYSAGPGGEHGAGFCEESDGGDYLFREHVLEALAALEGE